MTTDSIPAGKDAILSDRRVTFTKGDAGDRAYLIKRGKLEIREAGRAVESMEPANSLVRWR